MKDATSPASMLRWSLMVLTAAAVYVCWPLWPALVLAAWTAGLAGPLLLRLERRLKGTRRAAAALSLLLFLLLTLPLVAIVLGVLVGVQELAQLIAAQPSAQGALESIATSPDTAAPRFPSSFAGVIELLERHGAQGLSLLRNVAGAAASGLVSIFIYFAGAYVFLTHGPELWTWMKRHSPFAPQHLERFTAAFHETGHGLLIGVGLTSATQGVVATLVYLSLGVPRWWVLGPITGLASMIPLVGSALVWAPISVGLFLSDQPIRGSILLVLGLGVISTADNLLRPIYARVGSLQMPTFLLFVALFGGVVAFGTWGAILGPLIVRLWLEALALQREGKAHSTS